MARGYPISAEIQEALNKKSGSLGRPKNPYEPSGNENPRKDIQRNIVRTPYISMLSSPKLLDSTGRPDQYDFTTTDGKLDNLDVILSNQEYRSEGEEANFNPINYGLELYTDIQKQGDKYKFKDEEQYSSQFKPKPGVISLTSEYQSTSNVYYTRTVSVTWRCFHIDDLERLSRRFLTSNRLVYVEWGWAYPDEERTSFITPEGLKIISNPKSLREEVVKQGKGNFDAVLGYIQNFEWSSTGGGFECRTDIMSQGGDIFNQRVTDQAYFVNKEGARKKQELIVSGQEKTYAYLTEEEFYGKSYEEKYRILVEKGLKPGSFSVSNPEIYGKGGPFSAMFGRNKTIRYAGLKDTYAEKGVVSLEQTEDGLEIETNASSELQNSFKYTMDNLHLIVNDNMGSYGKQNIYKKTLFSKESEIRQEFIDTKEKNQDSWDEINKKVREEYDNDNWVDWPGGVEPLGYFGLTAGDFFTREDAKRRRATRRETDRRFEEEFGLSKSQLQTSAKRNQSQQIAEQPEPNTSEYLDIRFNSNLVQQTRTTTILKNNTTRVAVAINEETLSEEILPDRTWVRWGWFEDNILNRFFGLCSMDGTPIVQIRSLRKNPNFEELSDETKKNLEEALKSGGELAKKEAEKFIRSKEFEQERIFSNPGFLTPDINKFIFPGKFDLGEERGEIFEESARNKRRRKVLESQGYTKYTKYSKITNRDLTPEGLTEETVEFNKAQIFRKIDPKTKKVIDQQILLTGQITDNDIRTILSTNDVGSIGETLFGIGVENPELNLNKINADEIKQELQALLVLRELETIFQTNVSELGGIKPFDAPGTKYEGRLRNIFINVKHLQEIFGQEATLGTCVNRLLESFNHSAPIFNLVPTVLPVENEGHIVFQDIRFIPSKNVSPERVYSFPVKITESFVKTMSVQSDASSEANQILLSQRYSTMNLNSTFKDKKTGADTNSHRSFYSDENGLGSDKPGENQLVKEGERPFQKSETYGESQGDFQKELSLTGGISLTLSDKNLQYQVLPDEKTEEEKTTEGSLKYSQEVICNYNMNGVLKSRLQNENVNEFESEQFEISPYEEFGLIFVTNTMSLDGIAGLVPGMLYTSEYLPDKFLEKAYFMIQNTSQTIDSSTWTTEITGRVLHKFKETGGNLTNEQIQETYASSGD